MDSRCNRYAQSPIRRSLVRSLLAERHRPRQHLRRRLQGTADAIPECGPGRHGSAARLGRGTAVGIAEGIGDRFRNAIMPDVVTDGTKRYEVPEKWKPANIVR